MAHFLGIFLITCIFVISSVENLSPYKWNRRYSLGKKPILVFSNEDVVGGYNFGRSNFFNQYHLRYNPKPTISKLASDKNVLNSDIVTIVSTISSDTKNNTSEGVSGSTITIVGIHTERGSKEITDSDTNYPVTKDATEKLKYSIVDVANTDNNPSSPTAVETVPDTELKDPTVAVNDSVTNLESKTTENSTDSATGGTESVTNTDDTTKNTASEIESSTAGTEIVTDMKDTTTEEIASETTGVTESATETSNTITDDEVSKTDFSDTTTENTASETGISNTISTEETSKSNPSTAAVTELPFQSSSTNGITSQAPSEKTSNAPDTSQSNTDLTEAPSSQSSSISTGNIISSTVTQPVSSATDDIGGTSTIPPPTAPNWNRIKVAVSVLFVIIAVMSLGVLGTYFIRAKRETIQYDELTLLP